MGIKKFIKDIISTPTESGNIKKKNNTRDKTPFSMADRAAQLKKREAKIKSQVEGKKKDTEEDSW